MILLSLTFILGLSFGYALRARTSVPMKKFEEQSSYFSRAISEKHNLNELLASMTRKREELYTENLRLKEQGESLLKANSALFTENEKVTSQINRMILNSESLEKSLPKPQKKKPKS